MRRPILTIGATVTLLAAVATATTDFDDDFTGSTLRVDYYHTGTATEEHLTLDRVRVEGPWPGSRTQLIDTTNLGKYLVEVVDRETNRLLYSRGFCSIFGEWETTEQARKGTWRTLPQAVRIPEPRRPFQLRIRKRDRDQAFQEIWSICIDPESKSVDRPSVPTRDVWVLMEHGEVASKVDLVVLGDGYSTEEMDKFRADVERIVGALFNTEPFTSHKSDFNVRAVNTPAEHSGITRPHDGVYRNTPLGTRYDVFDMRRYVLTLDDRAWRDVAAAVPYDFVLILINEREYGGGGVFNLYAITAAGSASAPFLIAHEFGHAFAGLADEYYVATAIDEDVVGRKVEPWEPNVTVLLDPARLKWRDLVPPDTPVPTPWRKTEFDEQFQAYVRSRRALQKENAPTEALEAHRAEWRERLARWLGDDEYIGKLGAFEGAMYQVRGLYRPSLDCIMFTADAPEFCPVCRRAIERVIDLYTR